MHKPCTEEDIIAKCEELNLEYIGRYKTKHDTIIQFICKVHSSIGVQEITWTHLKSAKYACRICSGRYKNRDEFILGSPNLNKNVIILGEYLGNNRPILCKCADCDNEWITTPHSLHQGNGCPECGKIKAAMSRRLSQEEFEERVYAVNHHVKIVGSYTTYSSPINCKCTVCGSDFIVNQAYNLIHETVQCPFCTTSKPERELKYILDGLGIEYVFHYRFDDCKYINKLECDFAIFNNTKLLCIVEYDGEMHYYPIDFAGKGPEWAKEQHELTKKRDEAKNNYCKNNNIPIIRIPYWEKKNLKEYFLNQFNSIITKS